MASNANDLQEASTQKKREDKRSIRTKAAIKAAFLELAGTQPIENITVAAVTQKADINRKTFYCHYESMEELINEVISDDAEQLASNMKAATFTDQQQINVAELYESLCVGMALRLESEASIISHLNIAAWIKTMERAYVKQIEESKLLFGEGFSDEQVRYLVVFLVSGLLTTFQSWLKDDSELELEKLSELMSASVLGALQGVEEYRKHHME